MLRSDAVCCNRRTRRSGSRTTIRRLSLSDADARLLIANQEGYAYWGKYESYLYLDPAVQRVIVAVRGGDIGTLRDTLRADPAAANPRWVAGFHRPAPIPNDPASRCFASPKASFAGPTRATQRIRRDPYMLIAASADTHIEGDIVLEHGRQLRRFIDAVAALLDEGMPSPSMASMAMACRWRMQCISATSRSPGYLGRRGAKCDLRLLPAWASSMW